MREIFNAYMAIAGVFSGWALGYFFVKDEKLKRGWQEMIAEFFIALAFGLFWPICIIASSVMSRAGKRYLKGG